VNGPGTVGSYSIDRRFGVQQQVEEIEMPDGGCAMQRGVAGIVAGSSQGWTLTQRAPNMRHVGLLDGIEKLRQARSYRKPSGGQFQQDVHNLPVFAVLRHGEQRILKWVSAISGRVGALFQQIANEIGMAFAHGEVNGWSVVVLAANQCGAARCQRLHLRQITVARRSQHRPDIVVLQIFRLDHNMPSSAGHFLTSSSKSRHPYPP
jgi:hypothetical protein